MTRDTPTLVVRCLAGEYTRLVCEVNRSCAEIPEASLNVKWLAVMKRPASSAVGGAFCKALRPAAALSACGGVSAGNILLWLAGAP
jgi:hypothetical protein